MLPHGASAATLLLLLFAKSLAHPSEDHGSSTKLPEASRKCSEELEFLRQWHSVTVRGTKSATLSSKTEKPDEWHADTWQQRRRLMDLESVNKSETAASATGGEGSSNNGRLYRKKPTPVLSTPRILQNEPQQQKMVQERPEDTLKAKEEAIRSIQEEVKELRAELQRLTVLKARMDGNITRQNLDFSDVLLTKKAMNNARALLKQCNVRGWVVPKPGPVFKGYACSAAEDKFAGFLRYKAGGLCPDDWPLAQEMTFVDSCFALPKRRCLTRTPAKFKEPMPFPSSLFSQSALMDEGVRWSNHECKSFDCLNSRLLGDCRNCFIMKYEQRRWRRGYRGSLSMKEVVALKKGSLRIGLDAGGGSGSFAAHMARYGVTVMTTAMNIETVKGRTRGLPYMETIALRGLIPLHVPHKSRLPFLDNTLDIIHCVNSVKYLPILEFEELLYDWDRVLRVGGIMWFEMFYAPISEMPLYVALIENMGYKKLHWNVMPKPDFGEQVGTHVYLNCVIEKPVRQDQAKRTSWLFGT